MKILKKKFCNIFLIFPLSNNIFPVNFRDSKEIMMTSDSENKFKYSAQRANRTSVKFSVATAPTPAARTASAIPSSALAQQRERERVTTSTSTTTTTTSRPSTTLQPPYEVVAAVGGCQPHELRCVSGKCITVNQLCDKVRILKSKYLVRNI